MLFFLNIEANSENNVYIEYKINEEIITNLDIENEANYLIALNKELKNLDKKQILEIAKNSIIKETIKKIELLKYYVLDQKNPQLDNFVKTFYKQLLLADEKEFSKYLSTYNLTINEVKKKIEIESTWNALIYNKYKDLVIVDEKLLMNKISNSKKIPYTKNYHLSEIIFEKEKKLSLTENYKKIKESIDAIGFENTANIYSVADSAKFGGDVGWVSEDNLSEKLIKEISTLKINDITNPIQIRNVFLILTIKEIKEEKVKIDEKEELKKMIQYENDKQLNQFSKIYYNKVKINTNINEL